MLAQEGCSASGKQGLSQPIRRKEGLKVRASPYAVPPDKGVSTSSPTQATHCHHVWTWDFIFDRTDQGSVLKMLTMLGEFTCEWVVIRVQRQIQSEQVLARPFGRRWRPTASRSIVAVTTVRNLSHRRSMPDARQSD